MVFAKWCREWDTKVRISSVPCPNQYGVAAICLLASTFPYKGFMTFLRSFCTPLVCSESSKFIWLPVSKYHASDLFSKISNEFFMLEGFFHDMWTWAGVVFPPRISYTITHVLQISSSVCCAGTQRKQWEAGHWHCPPNGAGGARFLIFDTVWNRSFSLASDFLHFLVGVDVQTRWESIKLNVDCSDSLGMHGEAECCYTWQCFHLHFLFFFSPFLIQETASN